ncbi:MAG TPA: family 10 glycosylhydrolase, partial [Vicinamibacterales bacterium]|nr:family 10 glycosylhydrolase [Vicinamibacterales bacterium]
MRAALALTWLAVVCVAGVSGGVHTHATEPSPAPARAAAEIRAMWVLRTSLTTPEHIATLVRAARDHGFNTLLVQVRGRGDAYFLGGVEPRPVELLRQPDGFDPLATVLQAAHAAGLRVHAWVNVNLISSAADLPAAREHLIYRHPAWLMVPRDIAQELAAIEPESPAYVGKLARWTRAQPNDLEGLYASPIHPDAALYTENIVRDLTRRYAVDGVHLDYARYPSDRFDYSRGAIRQFRAWVRPSLAETKRRALDAEESVDLFAYPDGLTAQWRAFRVARMTALMTRLSAAVKSVRPDALVTAAAYPDAQEALERRLQDWGSWINTGLIDAICPMAYSPEPARFAEQIAATLSAAG